MNVTEKDIGKAGLSSEEAKVVRYRYGLSTAGKRTRKWVASLGDKKYSKLVTSSEKKLRKK